MSSRIKVLIVDDSALIRQLLSRSLASHKHIEVVGIAKDGVEAIEQAKRLDPDVITLDIEMPQLDGLGTLVHLPHHSSARVVMLSSADDPDITYEALSLGAVDFVVKPKSGVASSLAELSDRLAEAIEVAYQARPSQLSKALSRPVPPISSEALESREGLSRALDTLVVMAASTGGPPALERVFAGMRSEHSGVAYIVVQHLAQGFAASLARRLTSAGTIPFFVAEDRMALEVGMGYVAPYGAHLRVLTDSVGMRFLLDYDTPPIHGVRPAGDPLFESVAGMRGVRAVGVLLSGVGRDGVSGLTHIKDAGGATIVQDEETSVVWGMPGNAVRQDVADHIVSLDRIAKVVDRMIRGQA